MLPAFLFRLASARLSLIALSAAQAFGLVALAETAPPPFSPSPIDAQRAARRALREFDRFLDHHPLIEENLLADRKLAFDPGYLEKNSELTEFLRANAAVRSGLEVYPRYFLHRALLRQASAPLKYSEIAKLDPLLEQHPALEKALRRNPELIRATSFLHAHPVLQEFFRQQPELGAVFLPADPGAKPSAPPVRSALSHPVN